MQLQRGSGRHPRCSRTRPCRHFGAARRPAQPRNPPVRGRPQYFSVFAGIYGQLRAQGCGGSAPVPIGTRKLALAWGEPRLKTAAITSSGSAPRPTAVAAVPMEKRSRVGHKLATGEFLTMVEIVPPKGTDIRKEVEGAR